MVKYYSDEYQPKNPQKYVGKLPIIYRSAWERMVMYTFDMHPYVIQWASESITIPYVNPFTGRSTIYVPDFFVVYVDKNGKKHGEVIEVKPKHEAIEEMVKTRRDKAAFILNQCKWEAARIWCKHQGVDFRIVTEDELYMQKGKRSNINTNNRRNKKYK